MLESELQSLLRDRLGIRVEPEMSKYILRKAAETHQPVTVIGGDAKTGIPRRQVVDPQLLPNEVV